LREERTNNWRGKGFKKKNQIWADKPQPPLYYAKKSAEPQKEDKDAVRKKTTVPVSSGERGKGSRTVIFATGSTAARFLPCGNPSIRRRDFFLDANRGGGKGGEVSWVHPFKKEE